MMLFVVLLDFLFLGVLLIPCILIYVVLKCACRPTKRPKTPNSVLITGANSGIGEALALHYAKPGNHLILTGRNKERLEKVGGVCKSKGATVVLGAIDVTDRPAMERFILDCDKANPVDLVIANAGVSAMTGGFSNDIVQSTRQLFSINVDGVFNTVLPLIPLMKERQRGQIAIMSSIAGTGTLMNAPDYSSTKTAIRVWGEGIRGLLYRDNVFVNVICPGFVESPMTGVVKDYQMPMMQTMPVAVDRITRGLQDDEPVIIFPRPVYLGVWLVNLLPPDARHALARAGWVPGFAYLRGRRAISNSTGSADSNAKSGKRL